MPAADLTDSKPQVDSEAGAEILYRETILDHSSVDAIEDSYYVRAKIYTQRGLDDFVKIEIPYSQGTLIHYIEARTTKPDGTTVELRPEDVYDRDVVKTGGVRERVKSFAPPGLEVGAIVEYRYIVTANKGSFFDSLLFQSNLPARLVRFKLKVFRMPKRSLYPLNIRTIASNCPDIPPKADDKGFNVFEMKNMPAAKDEPFQPPAFNTTSAIIVYYTEKESLTRAEFWSDFSKTLHEEMMAATKATKLVRQTLAGIVSPEDIATVKLQKIYDYCRTRIVNRELDSTNVTEAERSKWKPNETASDVLKNSSGDHIDINNAFMALARAAGFLVRVAACNDRSFVYFSPRVSAQFMLSDRAVAVHVDSDWKYYDPGSTYLPAGALPWWNTDTAVLLSDSEGNSEINRVKGEPHGASAKLRTAMLELNADGTVEGNVTEVYTGLYEAAIKHTLDSNTLTEQENYVRQEIQEYQKMAEVTDVRVENAAAPLLPLRISYHLRIPGYADSTGSRLFVQPAVFQKGAPPQFVSPDRRTDLFFRYRYTQVDEIHLKLPENYSLEDASAPGGVDVGQLGQYTTTISFTEGSRELIYKRKFELTDVMFSVKNYPAIKEAFEEINKLDGHALALERKEPTAALPNVAGQEPPGQPSTKAD